MPGFIHMKFNVTIMLLPALGLLLCSYTSYNKCVPCAKTDLKGKIKQLTEVETIGDEEIEKLVYLYNEIGDLTEERDTTWKKFEGAYELTSISVIKYVHKDGLLLRKEMHNGMTKDDRKDRITDHKYDGKGRVISSYSYLRSAGGIDDETRIETSYDDNTGKSVQKHYSKNAKGEFVENMEQRLTEVHDKNGLVTEVWKFYPDSNKNKLYELKRYDQAGNLVESITRDQNGFEYRKGFRFDADGKLIGVIYALPTGMNSGFSYTYSKADDHGNPTLITTSMGITTLRQIEYYE